MKKMLLFLGAIATTIIPIATVISCENSQYLSGDKDTVGIENPSIQETKISPLKDLHKGNEKLVGNDAVNAKLFGDASKSAGFEKTDHDFIRVGGKDITIFKDGIVPLEKFNNMADFNHAFAEVRPDDYIDFIFDDKNDIKDFTNRVFYDNTLNPENNLPGMSAPFDSLHFNPYTINGDVVMAAEDVIGEFQSQGVKGSKSLFNITTPKQNVVRMTFNDIFGDPKKHLEAQLLYVKGFNDVNKDGKINLDDVEMTPTFALDGGEMYSNYVQPYKSTKLYWFRDWSVAVHDESIKNYLTKLYTSGPAAKAAPVVNLNAFDVNRVNWSDTFDATKIKDGDIIEILWEGAKNIAKVVKEGSELVLKLSNGEQFQDMYKVIGKDSTHISTTGRVVVPMVPPIIGTYEVIRMGTL